MFKTVLIVFFVIAAIAISGGSFYYFEVYQPRDYAVSLLSLYQKLESTGLQPDTSSLKDKTDYASALEILEKRMSLLKSIKGELLQIQTPRRMANFNKEFADYLDFAQAQHVHATRLTSFVKKGSELHSAIKDMYGGLASEQNKVATMRDLQKFWGERIPKTKKLAGELFHEQIKELREPSFAELEYLWENTSPAFDLVLKKVKTIDPNLPISRVGNLFTPLEAKQLDKRSKHLEEFIKKLEALEKQYSAYDLLAFRYFPDVSLTEASERALKFYQTIQKLKEHYGT